MLHIYIYMPLHYCLLWCEDSWQKTRSRQISRSAFTQSLEMSCWRLAACHLSLKPGLQRPGIGVRNLRSTVIQHDPTPPCKVRLCADECALVRFHADGQWHPSSPCCTMARDQDGQGTQGTWTCWGMSQVGRFLGTASHKRSTKA